MVAVVFLLIALGWLDDMVVTMTYLRVCDFEVFTIAGIRVGVRVGCCAGTDRVNVEFELDFAVVVDGGG